MDITIICRGCGQALQIGADESRPEIECLWCGTKSPVPGRISTRPVQPSGPTSTIRPVRPSAQPKPQPAWFEQTPYGIEGAPIDPAGPATFSPLSAPAPPLPAAPVKPVVPGNDDEDGSPYLVAGKPDFRCQDCGRVLAGEIVVCPSCGFNHETETKGERVYEPVERSWVAGWPLARRRQLFLVSQVVMLVMTGLGIWISENIAWPLSTWLVVAFLTAFVIGTYDRVDLTRTTRGKVVLKHTWRFCFSERPTTILALGQFEGIAKGKWHDSDLWDWLICLFLLWFGGIPGLLWWYYFIYRDMFFVALTKDHDHPEYNLYRGWSEEHMRDLYQTVKTVAFQAR